MDILIPLLAALLVFAAIVWVGVLVMRYRDSGAKRRSLALVASYASSDPHAALQKARKDESLLRKLALDLGTRIVSRSARQRIERQVVYCGRSEPDAADDVVVRKLAYLIGGLALGWLQGVALGGLWWLAVPVLGIFGYFVPDILLYNQGLKRDEEMGKCLPDALDMLNLCVESGLSFQAALSQVALNQEGPVAEEFALTLQEMQYGRSRGQALEALAQRARHPDIQRFVSAMLQVDKLGVPVAMVLREQAKEMRAKRYARAREMAQKVPVKILMPLMLCFLPALFVIILGPAVYGIVQVFSGV